MWWKNEGMPHRQRKEEARPAGAQTRASGGSVRRLARCAAVVLGLCLASLWMSGCGTDDIDISGYSDETLVLAGVTDDEITMTIADLKALDCVTVSAESTSDKIGRVRATGPTLDTVLRQFGMTQAQLQGVRVCGRDDYDVKLDRDTLQEEEIILAFGIDGQPLPAEDAPVRLIIPDSDSAWWVRMVQRLELE